MTDPKPTAAEIREWLQTQAVEQADMWADYLEGLPWGYVKPVVQIAVNAHHQHPAIALSTSAGLSTDLVFKLTARNHINSKGS